MTLLLSREAVASRRAAAADGLRPLADSLASDLRPLLSREPFVPDEKARLTRAGGRCAADGAMLDFDPLAPRAHRCPRCSRVYDDEVHYRFWIYWYQLWLAERAVHAAALHLLRAEPGAAAFADRILASYADRYLRYPNRDNVLGPSRPFFSTYLESIWLLQLAVALDLRETAGDCSRELSDVVRERLVVPSAALIASYDEGLSNRQVWNDAALLAAARLTGNSALAERALFGPSGVVALLDRALLSDGTWYEGDNYHQFAHRGLWYGVTLASNAGYELPPELLSRYDAGFATPFAAALPDFSFPSRRDSQYAVSLRQWRFAEMAELGLALGDDERLVGALFTLYDDPGDTSRRDTGRATSAAEAERNAPPSKLSRTDLGWRSLLFARESLPPLRPSPARSVLFAAQGLAVLRRDEGRLYAALDYGASGGGHGHPDRLNLLLVHGAARWLDDFGTGSYVERSLHWYRSTLAHNAPLVNGASQPATEGTLHAYDERGGAGWADASAEIAPGVRARRAVVVLPDYLVDELTWTADRDVTVDLPLHLDGDLAGSEGRWVRSDPGGAGGVEDGFDFVEDAEVATAARESVRLTSATASEANAPSVDARLFAMPAVECWRGVAPGPPGAGARRFHWLRQRGARGRIVTVWSWARGVRCARLDGDTLVVDFVDGARHAHERRGDGWHVALWAGGAASSIDLAGAVAPESPRQTPPRACADSVAPQAIPRLRDLPPLSERPPAGVLRVPLGETNYRRSEQSWSDAGSPTASVALFVVDHTLVVDVHVHSSERRFAAA
ncbi:MAG TPA: heparinase II/III family protein, partial [Gemmatimonadaceae bacterium]|nr:heparinase II/III family protein [Gemmatimonadaceae bacterium]